MWVVAQISTPPHYFRLQPLISFFPRTYYSMEVFYSLVCPVLVSCLNPQLGCKTHRDRDRTWSDSLS